MCPIFSDYMSYPRYPFSAEFTTVLALALALIVALAVLVIVVVVEEPLVVVPAVEY